MYTKFIFLILPETHLMDLAGPDQVFWGAIGYGADFQIEYCCLENGISTSAGLPFGTLRHFSEIEVRAGDFVFVPGSNTRFLLSENFKNQHALFEWLRRAHENGASVGSICVGTFALGLAGLLDGVACTTHFEYTKKLQQLFPKAKVQQDVLFVEEKNIWTSAGIASGMDMALQIVEQKNGGHFAHKIAREMVVYNRRNGSQTQHSELMNFRNHIHSGVHAVQDWLHEHLDEEFSLEKLAAVANMSTRSLTRIFKNETSLTVHEYHTLLRKERIRELLQNPDLSRLQIAQKCGLTSERQVNRLIQTLG